MKCDLGETSMFYESIGEGRPIVLLPGQPSDHRSMARFMEPIFAQREGWRRLYPDLPGTGQSPSAASLATPDKLLDAMLGFIDAVIPGQRFTLAGYSYGGYLARGVLHHRAAAIDGLLLCAPMMRSDPAQAQLPPRTLLVEDPALAAQAGPIADLLVTQTPPVVAEARAVLSEIQGADHAFLDRLESSGGPFSFDVDVLPEPFRAPTLVLTARQDNICGYRDAWELLDNYPRATYATLDRAGHFLYIEQQALCQALMNEWLNRVEEWVAA